MDTRLLTLSAVPRSERPVIVILSGAGLSASAKNGIPVWRNASEESRRLLETFDASFTASDPEIAIDGWNRMLTLCQQGKPNRAHFALANFMCEYRSKAEIVHITQNVDGLSDAAGDTSVIHLHGMMSKARCSRCGSVFPAPQQYGTTAHCPVSGMKGFNVRPDVVLTGEDLRHFDFCRREAERADIFIAVGTSGQTEPASSLIFSAACCGCRDRILITKAVPEEDPSDGFGIGRFAGLFSRILLGNAEELLPAVLREVGRHIDAVVPRQAVSYTGGSEA